MTKAPVSNSDVGARIGLTEGGVSRIRSGNRRPAPATMYAIEQAYGWDKHEQWELASFGAETAYAERFERVLQKDYEDQQAKEANQP